MRCGRLQHLAMLWIQRSVSGIDSVLGILASFWGTLAVVLFVTLKAHIGLVTLQDCWSCHIAVAAVEEEAEDKMEDEGQDAAQEPAEDAAGDAAGAADGEIAGDEAADEADGEAADVPVEGDATLQAASKEEEQNDPEGATGQEPGECEGEKTGVTPKKKATKPVTPPAQAGKGGASEKPKTRSQSEKGAAGKRSKPAIIEFPDDKQGPK